MTAWRSMLVGSFMAASALVVGNAALAQNVATAETLREVPSTRAQVQASFSPLVKETAPAVVNVYAAREVQQRSSPFAGDPFFEQFFGRSFGNDSPQRKPRIEQSLGSGVIIDASGIVITNNHVIEDADEIKVALSDGREYESRILLRDRTSDLAVLKIEGKDKFPALSLGNSDEVEVGDLVLAIGNPFGVGQTVTSGIVSAQSRTQVGISDFDFFIQTDAAINPGNSGGALVDMNGNLIGINTAIYSRSGGSIGIGFAIPSNMVKAVADAAAAGNSSFVRPFIGATFQTITRDVADSLGMEQPYGALISALVKQGPAEKAGLKIGDVILRVQGVRADNADVLGYRLSTAGIGNVVDVDILRDGKEQTIPVKLEKEPEVKDAAPQLIEGPNPVSGASVLELNVAANKRLRLPESATGVGISEVHQGSPAHRVGLRPADIIRGINGTPIRTIADLQSALNNGRGLVWRLEFERNGALIRQFVR
ncbi:DegQ family serine endoprotease [Brucellaceae bacterium C25G]